MKALNSPLLSIVICHYYLRADVLEALVKKILHSGLFRIRSLVIVHNNPQLKPNFEHQSLVYHIYGSNALLDLSAYCEGLKFLRNNDLGDDALFINDTLFTKLPSDYILKRLSKTIGFSQAVDVPCVVGFRADYTFFLQKNPWSGFVSHFCAAVFYANKPASDKLIAAVDCLSKKTKNIDSLDDCDVEKITGRQFFNYLKLVLFNAGSTWKPEYLIGELKTLKIKKALCFYLEHYFSAQIQQSEGGVIYINNGKYHFSFLVRIYLSFMYWKVRMFLRSKSSK